MTGSVSVLPTLWFGNASSTPTELSVREGEQVLGRAADADLCVSETFISTYHARLNWQRGQLKVLDLNSTNGTMVNGIPVVGWTTLTDGDVIQFGGVEAVVQLPAVIDLNEPAPTASPPPPPQHESKLTTGEFPRVITDEVPDRPWIDHHLPEPAPDDQPNNDLVDDTPAATSAVAPVTLPPTPPTGITITDIEAVTEGYGDFGVDMFGHDPARDGPFGDDPFRSDPFGSDPFGSDHPESVRRLRRNRRRLTDNGYGGGGGRRPTPAFSREGVSPIVIIIAVALLVVIILAAVFFS